MRKITKDNILTILQEGENSTIEFKLKIPENLNIVGRLVSGFANAQGGCVIFGYDEVGQKIVGELCRSEERLTQFLKKEGFTSFCNVYSVAIDDSYVIVLQVDKSRNVVYARQTAYIRYGDKIHYYDTPSRSDSLTDFIEEIQFRNRNPKDNDVLRLLEEKDTNPIRSLENGYVLYRCRVISAKDQLCKEFPFYGFNAEDSFVAPPEATRDMRANYRYIPYLYCANHPYTALVEVRPRIGAKVSVATIKVAKSLSLLDFTMNKVSQKMSEDKKILFSELSALYSKPVASDDDIIDYIPTQYIAEYSKNHGYDGIAFRSSLTPELNDIDFETIPKYDRYNVVIFNYDKCEVIGSNIFEINRSYIECCQIDDAEEKMSIENTMNEMFIDLRDE